MKRQTYWIYTKSGRLISDVLSTTVYKSASEVRKEIIESEAKKISLAEVVALLSKLAEEESVLWKMRDEAVKEYVLSKVGKRKLDEIIEEEQETSFGELVPA